MLLIISGFTLSNYSNISADMKNYIAEFSTMVGVIVLTITIVRAMKENKEIKK